MGLRGVGSGGQGGAGFCHSGVARGYGGDRMGLSGSCRGDAGGFRCRKGDVGVGWCGVLRLQRGVGMGGAAVEEEQ